MGLKRIVFSAFSGACMTSLFLKVGLLAQTNTFWDNFFSAILIWAVSNSIGMVLGGK